MKEILAVDMGSTMTKGALFALNDRKLSLIRREEVPTSRSDLKEGYFSVKEQLMPQAAGRPEIRITSSAHGGMNIYALGLVPSLTLDMARRTALGAGGWISGASSYELDEAGRERVIEAAPDIVLFSGGTEGGNKKVVLHNAEVLARAEELKPETMILYCGNSRLTRQISGIFQAHGRRDSLITAANILPELGSPRPEEARRAIREIFLSRIIRGKGLSQLITSEGTEPVPTPRAMLCLVEAVFAVNGRDFCLVDPGGATTDVYSALNTPSPRDALIKGLPEPKVRRTVEGDLGLRVSARQTAALAEGAETACPGIYGGGSSGSGGSRASAEKRTPSPLTAWANRAADDTTCLPVSSEETALDRQLAEICLSEALRRHAGRVKEVRTLQGTETVAEGRDLRRTGTLIYTGGYPSRHPLTYSPSRSLDPEGHMICTPESFDQARDTAYLWPLLAGVCALCPGPAAALAMDCLENVTINEETT